MFGAGDLEGQRVWQRILKAVDELLAQAPPRTANFIDATDSAVSVRVNRILLAAARNMRRTGGAGDRATVGRCQITSYAAETLYTGTYSAESGERVVKLREAAKATFPC